MNCIDLHLEHFYMYIWASCKCINVHGLFCFVVYMVILCHLTGKIKDSNGSIKSAVKAVLLPELQIITETEHLVNNTDKEKTD